MDVLLGLSIIRRMFLQQRYAAHGIHRVPSAYRNILRSCISPSFVLCYLDAPYSREMNDLRVNRFFIYTISAGVQAPFRDPADKSRGHKHLTSAWVILAVAQRLHETGSVVPNEHDTGRYREARNLRNTEAVIRAVEQNPETSIRVIAREHNLSYSAVQTILKKEKLHAYHYTRVQHLQAEDYDRRRIFCENFIREVDRDPGFNSRVIFSDESLFTREGIFNSHNMHVWSDENPNVTRSRSFQHRWKMNVWAGIMETEILGPVILPDILTGVTYVDFLQENLSDFLEEVPLYERNKIIFQQDGAGPHNARIVTNLLNEYFPGRWMGRYGPIRWPAKSPDLNPLDFFFWEYCKEIIYKTLPEDLEDLETRFRNAVWSSDEDMMENVQRNLLRRLRACIRMDGGHFEHLL